MRYYSVIYEAIDDVKAAITGHAVAGDSEQIVGLAEVRDVFSSPKFGSVAGCMVVEGVVRRSNPIRVLRDNVVIFEGELESLRRFKDDVNEVAPARSAASACELQRHQGRRPDRVLRAQRAALPQGPARRNGRAGAARVEIYRLELEDWAPPLFSLDVSCSKGTYVRTLVEDIARAAGSCAHVAALRRYAAGPYSGGDMYTLEALEALAAQGQSSSPRSCCRWTARSRAAGGRAWGRGCRAPDAGAGRRYGRRRRCGLVRVYGAGRLHRRRRAQRGLGRLRTKRCSASSSHS
jgi:hypothetical protein